MTMNIEQTSTNFTSPGTFQLNESLEEKKRKLTLKLNNVEIGSNPSSNSMSSNDSATDLNALNINSKKFRSNAYNPNVTFNQPIETSRNKDLLSNLDLPTPHLDKLIADFNASNNTILRTPGSSLELFTSSLEFSNSFANGSTLNTPRNLIASVDVSGKNLQNFLTPNTLLTIDMSQEKGGLLTPNSTLINPLNIFGATNLINTDNQSQETDNTPKYSNLSTVSQNTSYNIQPMSNLIGTNIQTGIVSNYDTNQTNNLLTNQNIPAKKDELQTVPVHSNSLLNGQKLVNGKKKTPTPKIKTLTEFNNQCTSYSTEMKKEPGVIFTNMEPLNISTRRNTDKSNSSSVDLFSPVNYADQEDLKLEKKRERNREAARKCRTRKLQKIADLEQKVKALTESNAEQKSKNKVLMDEINEIKLKLQTHKKNHNCDLKIDLYTS